MVYQCTRSVAFRPKRNNLATRIGFHLRHWWKSG